MVSICFSVIVERLPIAEWQDPQVFALEPAVRGVVAGTTKAPYSLYQSNKSCLEFFESVWPAFVAKAPSIYLWAFGLQAITSLVSTGAPSVYAIRSEAREPNIYLVIA